MTKYFYLIGAVLLGWFLNSISGWETEAPLIPVFSFLSVISFIVVLSFYQLSANLHLLEPTHHGYVLSLNALFKKLFMVFSVASLIAFTDFSASVYFGEPILNTKQAQRINCTQSTGGKISLKTQQETYAGESCFKFVDGSTVYRSKDLPASISLQDKFVTQTLTQTSLVFRFFSYQKIIFN